MLAMWLIRRGIHNAFDAVNQRDVDGFLRFWDDDVTFIFPGDLPASGEHVGKPAVRAWLGRLLDQFHTVRFAVRDVAVANPVNPFGRNVIFASWSVDLVNHDGMAYRNDGVSRGGVARQDRSRSGLLPCWRSIPRRLGGSA